MTDKKKPIIIKKYANRRLYDTETSKYITLDDLREMVKAETDFVVQDAKTGEDLTRNTLTQIIFEQETKSGYILPINFLRQLIRYYDDSLRGVLPHYLDSSMNQFMEHQDQMRQLIQKNMEEFSPFKGLEKVTEHNMALFEQAMGIFEEMQKKWTPFGKEEKK